MQPDYWGKKIINSLSLNYCFCNKHAIINKNKLNIQTETICTDRKIPNQEITNTSIVNYPHSELPPSPPNIKGIADQSAHY